VGGTLFVENNLTNGKEYNYINLHYLKNYCMLMHLPYVAAMYNIPIKVNLYALEAEIITYLTRYGFPIVI
jgi:hypothetical protein